MTKSSYIEINHAIYFNQNKDGHNILHQFAIQGLAKCVEHLVNYDNDTSQFSDANYFNLPDKSGYTPLILASISKDIDTVIALLGAKGVNVDAVDYMGNNALHYAASNGDIGIIKALAGRVCLDAFGGDVGFTALQIATQYGFDEAVQALIDAKAKVNIINNTGNTALHAAAYFGKANVAEVLLRGGADENIVNKDNCSALYLAAEKGHIKVVRIILAMRKATNLDLVCKDGFTALQIATKHGFDEVVQALIDAKANVNIMNFNTGNTALHLAVYFGKEKIVKDLIKAKARFDIKNNQHKTALDIAKTIKDETKREKIIELLTPQKVDLKNSEGGNPLIPKFDRRESKKRKAPGLPRAGFPRAGFPRAGFPNGSAAEFSHTLLHKATIEGKLDNVIDLLENFPIENLPKMINASTDNKVQIKFDSIDGKPAKVFNALLEDKTPKTGYTPIEFAAISGDNDDQRIKIIALLYKNGAKINLQFFKALFDYKKISKNLKEKIEALDPKNLDFDKLEDLPRTNPASSLAIRARSNEGVKEGP